MQYQLQHITQAALYIIDAIALHKIICFTASMGAGKTTLITEICKQLAVQDVPSSPTYSIINEYTTTSQATIYHLDLYRIQSVEEAIQAGVEDVLYSGNLCLVEWPAIAATIMPANVLDVSITYVSDTVRQLQLQ